MSSTESEVVAANQGIHAQGLPSLSLWFFMGKAGREAVPKAAAQPGTAVARIDPELDEKRYGGKTSDGRSVADIHGLHVSLPAKFKVRVMEDNQATVTILLTGSSNTMQHTERTQKVSFAWLRQQFEFGNFLTLNADTRDQVADIFTKPFTDRSKWQHALRLIAHTDAFHTSKVARGNPKPTETAAAPAKETTLASEELAKSLFKSKDFTYDALEELLQSMFAAGKSTFRAMQQRNKRSQHLVSVWCFCARSFLWHHGSYSALPNLRQVHQPVQGRQSQVVRRLPQAYLFFSETVPCSAIMDRASTFCGLLHHTFCV